jgi:hypothetical protein
MVGFVKTDEWKEENETKMTKYDKGRFNFGTKT